MDKPASGKDNGGMTRLGTKNRILYMHSAHQRVGVSRFAQWRESERRISPLTVDVFSTSSERDSTRQLIARLRSFDPEVNWLLQAHFDRGLPNDNPAEKSDCMLIFVGNEPFSAAMLDRFRSHAEGGGGALVALNAGEQTSHDWREFASEILGADLDIATSVGKSALRIAAGQHFHPVLQNVSAWEVNNVLSPKLASQALVFLEGIGSQIKCPLAWGLDNGKKRIFSTTLGMPEDLIQRSFFRLIWNALFWTLQTPSD
jgi:hypothetical protein